MTVLHGPTGLALQVIAGTSDARLLSSLPILLASPSVVTSPKLFRTPNMSGKVAGRCLRDSGAEAVSFVALVENAFIKSDARRR